MTTTAKASRSRAVLLGAAALLIVATIFLSAQTRQPAAAPAPAPEANPAPAPEAAPTNSPDTKPLVIDFPRTDEELYQWIRAKHDSIPRDKLGELSAAELPNMQLIVKEIELAGNFHMEHFPQSLRRSPVARMVGRAMVLNQATYLQKQYEIWKEANDAPRVTPEAAMQLRSAYLQRVEQMADIAAEPLYRELVQVHELHAESHLLRQNSAQAAEYYRKAVAMDRYHPYPDLLNLNYVNSLHLNESWDEGERACRSFFQRYPDSSNWPHIFFMLTKIYRYAGKPEKALAAWEEHVGRLRAGAAGQLTGEDGNPLELSQFTKNNYQRYLDRYIFYKAFHNMALGNHSRAIQYFEEFMDAIDKRKDGGLPVNPASTVYRDYQAVPYHQFLIAQAGRPAPPLAMPDDHWVISPEDVDMHINKPGQVQIIVFGMLRTVVDRQKLLMDRLVQLLDKYHVGGLRMCWITNGRLQPENLWQQNFEQVANYSVQFGDKIAVGVDGNMSAHAAYRLAAGTVNVFLVDRANNLAWRIIDPLPSDFNFVQGVVERLLKEPAPAPQEEAKEAAGGGK